MASPPGTPTSPRPVPWVSILTPVYTGWEYLAECAMSVYLQTTRHGDIALDWEWWIGVNGHGPDGGPALAAALRVAEAGGEPMRDRVHVVNLPDVRGKAEAMNALAARATGTWVAVLDCDDTWDRHKLMAQRVAAESEAAGAAVIGTYCFYFGDMVSGGPKLPSGWIQPDFLATGNPLINSSTLIRRGLARWSDRFGLDDYDLWIRLAKAGHRLFNIPLRLVHHRIHAGSAFNAKGVQDVGGLLRWHGLKEA